MSAGGGDGPSQRKNKKTVGLTPPENLFALGGNRNRPRPPSRPSSQTPPPLESVKGGFHSSADELHNSGTFEVPSQGVVSSPASKDTGFNGRKMTAQEEVQTAIEDFKRKQPTPFKGRTKISHIDA